MDDLEARLRSILLANDWFVRVLRTVRGCGLPDWIVGAGAVRTIVWDHLHGYEEPTSLRDIDVAYFDPGDISRERDREIEQGLGRRMPDVPWQVTNQAGVHLWYEEKFGRPFREAHSIEDALSRWADTAACVGIRLDDDNNLLVLAPLGLDDLMGMVMRRNAEQVSAPAHRRRVSAKGIAETWPLVTVIDE